MIYKRIPILIFLAAFLLTGCSSTLQRKAGQLSAAADGSAAKIGAYYDKLNAEHRKMIMIETGLASSAKLGSISSLSADEALPEQSKKVRVKTAQALETYCTQLKVIASAKSSQEIETAVSSLNNKIGSLADQIPDDAPNGIKAVVKKLAISQALGKLTQLGFAFFRDNWIRTSVQESRSTMANITTVLEVDLKGASTDARAEAALILGDLKTALKQNEGKFSSDERQSLLKKIEEALTRYQTITNDAPVDALQNIRTIHAQLADLTDEELKKKRFKVIPWGGK